MLTLLATVFLLCNVANYAMDIEENENENLLPERDQEQQRLRQHIADARTQAFFENVRAAAEKRKPLEEEEEEPLQMTENLEIIPAFDDNPGKERVPRQQFYIEIEPEKLPEQEISAYTQLTDQKNAALSDLDDLIDEHANNQEARKTLGNIRKQLENFDPASSDEEFHAYAQTLVDELERATNQITPILSKTEEGTALQNKATEVISNLKNIESQIKPKPSIAEKTPFLFLAGATISVALLIIAILEYVDYKYHHKNI